MKKQDWCKGTGWGHLPLLLVSGLLILAITLAIAPDPTQAPEGLQANDSLDAVFGGTACAIFWWITEKSIHL